MAKVLLVQPHNNLKDKTEILAPPSSLIYVATAIEHKHPVKIYDRNLSYDDEAFLSYLKEYNPDIIGFTAMTSTILYDIMHLGPIIKKEFPKAITIVGGVHPTIEPDSLLNEPYIDYILRGEGEEAFLEFCDTFDKNPRKLGTLKNINKNPMRPFLDINKLKFPNYSLVDVSKYSQFFIITGRGCPGTCTFCYNLGMWGKDGSPCVRVYDIEKTKMLFKELIEKHNIVDFTIGDENFITFKERSIEVGKFLRDNYKGKINFLIFGRADFMKINEESLPILRDAGCHTIQMGSESGSQRILDFLNKRISVKTQAEAMDICRRNKIFSDASFMVGIPTETYEDMELTEKFLKETKPDISDIKVFNPIPGTKIFDDLVAQGKIKKPVTLEEWAEWTGNWRDMKHNFSEVSDEVLEKMASRLWAQNYYRGRIKKALYWIKMGRFRYVLKKVKINLFKNYLRNTPESLKYNSK
ncbi:MAG: radical SAM protein [Candidatus Pacearchaeota archaeon]